MRKNIFVIILCVLVPFIKSNAEEPTKELKTNTEKQLKSNEHSENLDEYEFDDDILPISFIFSPCMNFLWSKSGEAKDVKLSFGSLNIIRLTLLYDLQIAQSNFFISFGIGWTHQDYVFSDKIALYKKPGKKVAFVQGEEVVYNSLSVNNNQKQDYNVKSTYLYTKYLEGTMEIQFRQNSRYYKEGFFTTLGVKLGYCFINPVSLVSYSDSSGAKTEFKSISLKEDLGINALKFASTFRIGYGIFGAFVEWSFTNIFSRTKFKDHSTAMKPICAGLTIDFF